MKVYTRTGDEGETGLFGGGRVLKDHPRVEAYGTVDELNAVLGKALEDLADPVSRDRLSRLQHDLFALGAVLASPPPGEDRRRPELPRLPSERVKEMERWMDEAEAELPALRNFILPGGCAGASALHVCRTVCRRAERRVAAVAARGPEEGEVLRFLNRLSDLFFVLARVENLRQGTSDVEWEKPGTPDDEPES